MNTKQMRFLQALLESGSKIEAAKAAGISVQTGYNYLKDEAFRAELDRRRSECIADTVRYLQGKLSHCSEELIRIINDLEVSEQVKINAINAVFSVYRSLSESAEIQARLDQITAKLTLLEESEQNA